MDNRKIINRIRFMLSLCFGLFLSLPWYLWITFSAPVKLRDFKYDMVMLSLTLFFLIPSFLIGYFFLFAYQLIEKFIFKKTSFYIIFLFETIGTTIIGVGLWWFIFNPQYIYGCSLGFIGIIVGGSLGLIFGLISAIVIKIFSKKLSQKGP